MSGAEHLGPYLLEVKEGVFPLGGDSLALGAFATVKRGWRVCDLGTGSGLEPKRMRLLAHGPEHPPSCVLMEAVRRGRPGLRIEP